MRLRYLGILFAVLLLLGLWTPSSTRAAPVLTVSAPEAVVLDGWTGSVLYAKAANTPRYPASTTKIMTALVVLRRHVAMSRVVTVSPYAASIPGSTAGLWTGEKLTLWDLLHGLLLPSGNDAAEALAEFITPSSATDFVNLMNLTASRLGLRHTRFLTPDGLDVPGQYTTARDLARLARIAMQVPAFASLVHAEWWTARPLNGPAQTWRNLNKLLWQSRAVDGVKTGTTAGAGACLVSSARKAGRWVIAVNLGSAPSTRFSDAMRLLNYGFRFASVSPSA